MTTTKILSAFGSTDQSLLPEHVSTNTAYEPEDSPFETIQVNVTYRCNMECHNCFLPNRQIPDMDKDWLYDILSRLSRQTELRISGGEPTLRNDLPEIIRKVIELGHIPVLLTNGLRLADRKYVKELIKSKLRAVHLSFSGGLDDEVYLKMDGIKCAYKKLAALKNLSAKNFNVSFGTLVVRDCNEHVIPKIWELVNSDKNIPSVHFRTVGAWGRYMENEPYTLDQLIDLFSEKTGVEKPVIHSGKRGKAYIDFIANGKKVQLTQWPDMGSKARGRLAPDGTIQPLFEHMIANSGGF